LNSAPDIAFFEPKIPGNTGNAIRLAACVGNSLHLIEPLGFDMSDAKVRRAGLDYHELSRVQIHSDFDAFLSTLDLDTSIYAFTGHTDTHFDTVTYQSSDILLFGPEPTGLPPEILGHPRITQKLRIPMLEGVRSLNLAVSASIAVYEAWRQMGFVNASK
jgi:tRNA (cytidine/uridine-2'-O-)-methyltransferase